MDAWKENYETYKNLAKDYGLPDVSVEEWKLHAQGKPYGLSLSLSRIRNSRTGVHHQAKDMLVKIGYFLGSRDKPPKGKSLDEGTMQIVTLLTTEQTPQLLEFTNFGSLPAAGGKRVEIQYYHKSKATEKGTFESDVVQGMTTLTGQDGVSVDKVLAVARLPSQIDQDCLYNPVAVVGEIMEQGWDQVIAWDAQEAGKRNGYYGLITYDKPAFQFQMSLNPLVRVYVGPNKHGTTYMTLEGVTEIARSGLNDLVVTYTKMPVIVVGNITKVKHGDRDTFVDIRATAILELSREKYERFVQERKAGAAYVTPQAPTNLDPNFSGLTVGIIEATITQADKTGEGISLGDFYTAIKSKFAVDDMQVGEVCRAAVAKGILILKAGKAKNAKALQKSLGSDDYGTPAPVVEVTKVNPPTPTVTPGAVQAPQPQATVQQLAQVAAAPPGAWVAVPATPSSPPPAPKVNISAPTVPGLVRNILAAYGPQDMNSIITAAMTVSAPADQVIMALKQMEEAKEIAVKDGKYVPVIAAGANDYEEQLNKSIGLAHRALGDGLHEISFHAFATKNNLPGKDADISMVRCALARFKEKIAASSGSVEKVLGLIKRLDTTMKGAKFDDLLEEGKKEGLSRPTVEEAVNALIDKGEIYEPTVGWIKYIQ